MAQIYLSLWGALAVAAVAPFIASLVPGRAIPEVVFLVFGGAVLGTHGLGVIDSTLAPIDLVADLGMGFLFLKAGYEIDPRDLLGHTGRCAAVSWAVSLALGYAVVALFFSGLGFGQSSWVALAICMTTTAYGTLAPIMQERKLGRTRVGRAVTVYGSLGELLPVLAMSFLLSSRSMGRTAALLVTFVVICLLLVLLTSRARNAGARFWRFLVENAGSSKQPMLRVVSLLLVFLLFASTLFRFDAALGAFAAGFVLRALFPEGNPTMEEKIDIVSNGFFQPAFFVISGAGIDLTAATRDLPLLFGFMLALVVVRGLVVAVTLKLDSGTRGMSWQEVFSTAAYCTMALPLIVAITGIAVDGGLITSEASSVLVTSAALTVLVIPVLTSFVRVVDEADAVHAARRIAHHEAPMGEVVHEHAEAFHERERAFLEERREQRRQGRHFSSTDYLARSGGAGVGDAPAVGGAAGSAAGGSVAGADGAADVGDDGK